MTDLAAVPKSIRYSIGKHLANSLNLDDRDIAWMMLDHYGIEVALYVRENGLVKLNEQRTDALKKIIHIPWDRDE